MQTTPAVNPEHAAAKKNRKETLLIVTVTIVSLMLIAIMMFYPADSLHEAKTALLSALAASAIISLIAVIVGEKVQKS